MDRAWRLPLNWRTQRQGRNSTRLKGLMRLLCRNIEQLWGSLVGDALGVPVEFKDRAAVQRDPVKDMRGYGSHRQPPGTWSDDSSLSNRYLSNVREFVEVERDLSQVP